MRGFYATTALAMLLGCSAVTASGQEMTAQSRAEAAGDAWAATTEAQMTDAERFSLLHGFMPIPIGPYANPELQPKWPADVISGAGYVPGIARLRVPSLREPDPRQTGRAPVGDRGG